MSPIEQPPEKLHTTTEVARMLGRTPRTIRFHSMTHGIGTEIGRTRVYTAAEIERLRGIATGIPGRKRKFA